MGEFIGFIDLGDELVNVQEAKLLASSRYSLRIVDAKAIQEEVEGRTELTQVNVRVIAPDVPDSAAIFHTCYLPTSKDDPDKRRGKLLFTKRFLYLFSIPVSSDGKFDPKSFIGREAFGNVNLRKYTKNDGTEGEKNEIVLPPLPRG